MRVREKVKAIRNTRKWEKERAEVIEDEHVQDKRRDRHVDSVTRVGSVASPRGRCRSCPAASLPRGTFPVALPIDL